MTSLSEIANTEWDVVVIGAGPAGAAAALVTARSGLGTLLLDRQSFPRAKVCGGCVSRRALEVLESMGLGRTIRALPGRPFFGFHLRTAHGGELELQLPEGMAVTRSALDGAVVAAARREGAEFVDGVQARLVPEASARSLSRAVECSTESGRVRVFGRVVLAADGLGHSSLGRGTEFGSTVARRSRVGLGTLVEADGRYEPGTIHMALCRFGYVGLVRAEGSQLDIAAAVDPSFLKDAGVPRLAVERVLDRAGMPVPTRLGDAVWQGTAPLTQKLRRAAGWRVLAIGDAAGYVEPFTGEGIGWALTDAALAGAFVRDTESDWREKTAREWIRRRRVADRQRFCRTLGAVIRNPVATELGVRMLRRFPALGETGIRRFSGIGLPLPEIPG